MFIGSELKFLIVFVVLGYKFVRYFEECFKNYFDSWKFVYWVVDLYWD